MGYLERLRRTCTQYNGQFLMSGLLSVLLLESRSSSLHFAVHTAVYKYENVEGALWKKWQC
jgi:hypothetical protein